MKVLVSQNDKNVQKQICDFLTDNGYEATGVEVVDIKHTVQKALPDLLIVDTFGREEAASSGALYVIVSAEKSEKVKVEALDGGAEDYIVRPFMKNEFLARLRVVCRRLAAKTSFAAPGLEIDIAKHKVLHNGKEVKLTPIEFKIVEVLCSEPGKVFTHEYILKKIWGPYVQNDNKILRVNITNIRKKLEPDPANPVYIITENGIGYKISHL